MQGEVFRTRRKAFDHLGIRLSEQIVHGVTRYCTNAPYVIFVRLPQFGDLRCDARAMSSMSDTNPWPAGISTSRLLLRPAEPTDVQEFTRLWTDPEVRRFLGGPLAEQELRFYRQHFTHRPNLFTVTTREGATVVGSVVIDPASRFDDRREVSYGLLPEHWGQGYAREAVAAVVWWIVPVPLRTEFCIG